MYSRLKCWWWGRTPRNYNLNIRAIKTCGSQRINLHMNSKSGQFLSDGFHGTYTTGMLWDSIDPSFFSSQCKEDCQNCVYFCSAWSQNWTTWIPRDAYVAHWCCSYSHILLPFSATDAPNSDDENAAPTSNCDDENATAAASTSNCDDENAASTSNCDDENATAAPNSDDDDENATANCNYLSSHFNWVLSIVSFFYRLRNEKF